ncbi:MAG: NADH-quinone oxidoreductase subunit J [Gammaproteobacteria bacterium]|nr:MAG: NADH-quinone oxidoreductase subunit J [Gammaproteobacteria bacterium]
MTVVQILFYFFATVLVVAALRVITVRNPVHAALFLVLAFFSMAGIWLLLEQEFLAIVLVLVYVGAVMVLFLFVVMMLDINLARLREGFVRYVWVGAGVALLIVVQLYLVFSAKNSGIVQSAPPVRHGPQYSNTEELGKVLYTTYVYAFEIAAVILLVAIVAAIALSMRRRAGTKHQRPSEQVAVRRADRIRIVKMPAEKKQN